MINHQAPNAFASGRDPDHALIAITSGLRQKLNRDELQAVIAHEMAHIQNYDTRLMMLVGVFAGFIVLMSDFFIRSSLDTLKYGNWTRGLKGRAKSKGPWIIVAVILGAILSVFAPLIAKMIQLAVSREREYLADATAVKLCRNPHALMSALKKLVMDKEPSAPFANHATEHLFIVNPDPKRRFSAADKDSIWRTHPPIHKRIERISKVAY